METDRYMPPPTCRLTLAVTGATAEDIARGIAAAQATFNSAGVLPYVAKIAAGIQEQEDPDVELTDEEWAWAELWREAERAALIACIDGRPAIEPRFTDGLSLDYDV